MLLSREYYTTPVRASMLYGDSSGAEEEREKKEFTAEVAEGHGERGENCDGDQRLA